MPPKPKTPEQLRCEKKLIIDEAVKLIVKSGMDKFSVRKLSKQLGMSPANLYNYFYNKDEINIAIRIRGFTLLYNTCDNAVSKCTAHLQRLEAYVRQFISFGIKHPEYYKLMFTADEPKYLDYVGTPLEELAAKEKKNSMRSLYYLENLLKEIMPGQDSHHYHLNAARIICEIHGIISLTHSHILKEMDTSTEMITNNMIGHLLQELSSHNKTEEPHC